MLTTVISGGQLGSDLAGLLAASCCGLKTSGWIPSGWKTELGPRPDFARFGLKETPSSKYEQRTEWNVRDSDGTIIISRHHDSPGTKLTKNLCIKMRKPLFAISFSKQASENELSLGDICDWIEKKNISILNVSGNRESVAVGIQVWATHALIEIFKTLQGRTTIEDN